MKRILILGDILAIALITVIGFASHGEVGAGLPSPYVLPRMAAIYFPLSISWFLLAPSLGLFRRETIDDQKQLWRPVLTAFFAASLAVILRGLILNSPIIPIFGIILGVTTALGMVLWRGLFMILDKRSH